jgi:hypothetical protein
MFFENRTAAMEGKEELDEEDFQLDSDLGNFLKCVSEM